MNHPLCRHCKRPGLVARQRGLCWTCYYTLDIRAQYPSMSKYAPGSPAQVAAAMSICTTCGCRTGYATSDMGRSGVCSTCTRPEPFRSLYHARIAEFEKRAELSMPLFG